MTTRLARFAALLLPALMTAGAAADAQAPMRPAPPPARTAPAQPQPPATPDASESAKLRAFTSTPGYAGLVKQALDRVPPQFFQRCPSLVSQGSQITILRPVTFADDGFPTAGIWKHAFPVSGCGPDTIVNFFFMGTPERIISVLTGLPGSTRADPPQQHEAQIQAVKGATAAAENLKAPACTTYNVRNTKFEAFGTENPPIPDPGATNPSRPWWESWTVEGCGRAFLVPIDFTPRGNATDIVQPGHVTEGVQTAQANAQPTPYALHILPSMASPSEQPAAASPPPISNNPSNTRANNPTPPGVPPLSLPGSTRVDPKQQRDAMAIAIAGATAALQTQGGVPCPTYTIVNTRFEAFGLENPPTPDPGPTAPDRSWWESWTASGCGRNFLVPLDFTPQNGLVKIAQPGHVTQPPMFSPSENPRNPYAKDEPALPAPAPTKP